jgi:hypothetical protein
MSNFAEWPPLRDKFAIAPVRPSHNLACLALLSVFAGCATAPSTAPASTAANVAVILTARPLWQSDDAAGVVPALGRIGGKLEASATEFIVRTAEGRLISVVQPAEPALRAGQAVTVQPGQQTRLTANAS